MRPFFLMILVPFLCQCGAQPTIPATSGNQPTTDTEYIVSDQRAPVVGYGIDSYFYGDASGTEEARVTPTFWFHADEGDFEVTESESILKKVRAVVYRDDAENLTIEAPLGTVDRDRKLASMSGGVKVVAGTIRIEMDEISYDHSLGTAETVGEARMFDGETRMEAGGLSLHPDDNAFELVEVRGQYTFEGGNGRVSRSRATGTAPVILAVAVYHVAQDSSKKITSNLEYESIEIHRVGILKGNYASGRLLEMTDGVSVTFIAADPIKNLTIRAQTVTFEYASDDTRQPSKIIIDGDVTIEHREYTMRSAHAEIDFDIGEALFTGEPIIEGPIIQGKMTMKSLLYSLNDNKFIWENAHDSVFELSNPGEKPNGDKGTPPESEKEE